ncbi:MAG: M4 family metallopeptidase [Candidatus Thiodiazotropha sp.]
MSGLKSFTIHQMDYPDAATFRAMSVDGLTKTAIDKSTSSAEAAAQQYLSAALGNPTLPSFNAADVNGAEAEFKSLGVEQIPFTKTQTVKFRQYYRKIPVYGSIVTVEVDQENSLVSLNSSVGEPANVDNQAAIAPKHALAIIREDANRTGHLDATPRLYYYFDEVASRWRLVYIVEDVFVQAVSPAGGDEEAHNLPEFFDYVVDAATGEIVEKLPRTQTMARDPITESALDGLETQRIFDAINDTDSNKKQLEDTSRNIHTHDFEFRDAFFQFSNLPGDYSSNPPTPWDAGAVSAHANSTEVANFLLETLQRNGLDGQGGKIVSSVNCTWQNFSGSKEWRNAARVPGQMIYGQRIVDGELVSYAVAKDVVAHELLHGLTDHTARLEYKFESGALNESYSDIFGIIVANSDVDNVDNWDWEMGEELSSTGLPMRDMADPARRGQPAHMDDYRDLGEDNDHGGVHVNSGIHNKAAHLILTAKNDSGVSEFDPVTVARLFYLTLSQDLSRTSKFTDSRRGMEKWTKTLFRDNPDLPRKLQAVSKAYEDVGISQQ